MQPPGQETRWGALPTPPTPVLTPHSHTLAYQDPGVAAGEVPQLSCFASALWAQQLSEALPVGPRTAWWPPCIKMRQ